MSIIVSEWEHGARAWSIRPAAARGELVWVAAPWPWLTVQGREMLGMTTTVADERVCLILGTSC